MSIVHSSSILNGAEPQIPEKFNPAKDDKKPETQKMLGEKEK
jgi:hypothetical protein